MDMATVTTTARTSTRIRTDSASAVRPAQHVSQPYRPTLNRTEMTRNEMELLPYQPTKRLVDCCVSTLVLVVLIPVFAVIACAILCETGFPILFKQTRVGKNGELFKLLKFRTMRHAASGPSITASGDVRITRTGKVLRKFKLDELPQFWNVLRGEMSLVGPRPEVPEFVDSTQPIWNYVLQVRPGITDPTSIAFRNEEKLLAKASDRVAYYRETILPAKLKLTATYLGEMSLWNDLTVIARTAKCAMFPGDAGIGEMRI
jgi:lipopolysaccharide/colanic/teichoic acid biosynthesis glycosyltransferase